MATRERHQIVIALIALIIPALIVVGFAVGPDVQPPDQEIYFLPSWPASRSDAEIVAQQKIDQAAIHKAEAEKRAAFRRIQQQLHFGG